MGGWIEDVGWIDTWMDDRYMDDKDGWWMDDGYMDRWKMYTWMNRQRRMNLKKTKYSWNMYHNIQNKKVEEKTVYYNNKKKEIP